MKKKLSLKEKPRRSKQNDSGILYHDGRGGLFTMTKIKDGYKVNK